MPCVHVHVYIHISYIHYNLFCTMKLLFSQYMYSSTYNHDNNYMDILFIKQNHSRCMCMVRVHIHDDLQIRM